MAFTNNRLRKSIHRISSHLESLPVGGTGKVQKNELRKDYGGVFS